MNARTARPAETQSTIADEMMDRLLWDWSGLRFYLRSRKAGAPTDNTMETLLAEVLRTRLPGDANIPHVMRQLSAPG